MPAPRSARENALLPVGGSLLVHGLAAVVLGVGSWWLTSSEELREPPEIDVMATEERPDIEGLHTPPLEVIPPQELAPELVEVPVQPLDELLPKAEVEMLMPHPPIDWRALAQDSARVRPPGAALAEATTKPAESTVAVAAEPAEVDLPVIEPPAASEASALVESPQVDSRNCPPPSYPRASRRRGEQGLVEVLVMVDAKGVPTQVSLEVSSGHDRLDEAALQAVRDWSFHPARNGAGEAIAGELVVPVRFRIDGRD